MVSLLLLWPIVTLSNGIAPGVVHRHLASHLSLPVLVLFAIINPFFEETMETGYFVQSLQRYGIWGAVLAGAALEFGPPKTESEFGTEEQERPVEFLWLRVWGAP